MSTSALTGARRLLACAALLASFLVFMAGSASAAVLELEHLDGPSAVEILGMLGTLIFWGANPRMPIGG